MQLTVLDPQRKRDLEGAGFKQMHLFYVACRAGMMLDLERCHRHNFHGSSDCALCAQLPESIDHLLVSCSFCL
jgi:hypothetical protein